MIWWLSSCNLWYDDFSLVICDMITFLLWLRILWLSSCDKWNDDFPLEIYEMMTFLLYFLIWWLFSCDLMNFLLWFKMWWLSSYGLWFDDFPLLFLIWWLSSVCDPMYSKTLKNHEKKWLQRRYMAERNLQISSGICPATDVPRHCTVVFAWKCRLFCLCAYGQCRVYCIYHVEFHFRFRRLVSFPV